MNTDKERALTELARRNPFWVCFAVFLVLSCDGAFRLANQADQRGQLDQARLMQAQNLGALAEAQQLEARLQAFSLDLLQIAKTNGLAKQIVQEFNIRWNPSPAEIPAMPPAMSIAAPAAAAPALAPAAPAAVPAAPAQATPPK